MSYHNIKCEEEGNSVRISGPCVATGKIFSVLVPKQEFFDYYEEGMLAQDAFKSLSAEQREFLISGLSPEGWKLWFPEA